MLTREGEHMIEVAENKSVSSKRELVGQQSYELKLVLPVELKQTLEQVVEPFRGLIEQYGSRFLSPDLVLARFQAREEMEPMLIRWLNRILSAEESFSFAFNNYGSNPGARLYWRLQDTEGFRRLADKLSVLDAWFEGNGSGRMQLLREPRLVLLQDIHPLIERRVLMAFSSYCHHMDMEASELELMMQDLWAGTAKRVCRFSLLPAGLRRRETDND
jgi:hypothetical protein